MSARGSAINLAHRVIEHRQTLDDALAQEETLSALTDSDRAFARAMTSALLRHLGRVDAALSTFVDGRSVTDLDEWTRNALRIGAAQLWCLETSPHAAVSETVATVRQIPGARRSGGLINAVLRRASEDRSAFDALPATLGWPDWFTARLTHDLGADTTLEMALAKAEPPPLDLTVKGEAELWASRLEGEALNDRTVRRRTGTVENMDGFEGGDWWVQDAAASLPVALLNPQPGETHADICAAPGGKTLQIAASGANTIAIDRSAKRLGRVRDNLERTGLTADLHAQDADKWTPDAPLDGVLLDAPCSAFGTLRRHPESPWIKTPADIERFPEVQARLLRSAAAMVKPGGRVVYCVCTPLSAESLDVVETFLAETPGFERVPVTAEEAGIFAPAITAAGDMLTVPPLLHDQGGCDVFYIARLKRL